jgi:predicted acyltransferase
LPVPFPKDVISTEAAHAFVSSVGEIRFSTATFNLQNFPDPARNERSWITMPTAASPVASSPTSGTPPAPIEQTSVTRPAPARVLSIDVLRGLTIALMILVNDPGDWAHTYTQLDHAPWNGFTLTDFVFPNFLFLVGASIIFSLRSRIARGASKKTIAFHILRRAFLIFAVKMFLTAFPYFHYTHFRIYGVLTRIALCYLVAGIICLVTQRARTLIAITASLLIGYWILMRFVPVPGLGTPTHDFPFLDPDRNLAAWLDRAISAFTQRTIHTGTLYEHTRDPEGLLSTLPAIATTLIGCLTGLWLRRVETPASTGASVAPQICHSDPEHVEGEEPLYFAHTTPAITPIRCLNGLIASGVLALAAGLLWNPFFPINKNLWTSSYVLFSAGWSLLTLALCYWLIDMRRLNDTPAGKTLLWPWLVFGSNAITAFVISNLIVKIMLWIKVSDSFSTTGKPVTAWFWTYRHLFARNGSTEVTSLIFAIAVVAVCFLPNWFLWRNKVFLKI